MKPKPDEENKQFVFYFHCVFPWAQIKLDTSQEEGKDNRAGAVGTGSEFWYRHPLLTPVVKVRRAGPKLACDTDPQTGTCSGPGICL